MDEWHLEIAQRIQQEQIQAALSRKTNFEGDSETFCVECGDDIPLERQKALKGVKTCFACASKAEGKRVF
jgi:phage/conjugal plasmid C-4 type zinc finger TraR family protein